MNKTQVRSHCTPDQNSAVALILLWGRAQVLTGDPKVSLSLPHYSSDLDFAMTSSLLSLQSHWPRCYSLDILIKHPLSRLFTHCPQGLYFFFPRYLYGPFLTQVPVKGQLLNTLFVNTPHPAIILEHAQPLPPYSLLFPTRRLLTANLWYYFCWGAEIFVFWSLKKSLAPRVAPGMQSSLKYVFNVVNKGRGWRSLVTHTR